MAKDKVVAYFYDEECCNYNYGGGNPMRPHRVRLTHSLVEGYGLANKLVVHRPRLTTADDLTSFHADEYIDFLRSVTPDNQEEFLVQMRRFNLGPVGEADCPVFDGMFQYFQTYTGGSVGGAAVLNSGDAEICLNWAGGMHHAKKAEASGFCYINDIVLAVLELLKVHHRVLYVDIDIHHGDGVEEAFYTTNRVMTVSFHKYGDFFPGTGALGDVGYGKGRHYSVNVPLREGMDDESYRYLFEPIMQKVMEVYQPGAVVMCCGADSLSGDRLGCFNLSMQGHSNCIEFLARWGVPLLVLGGGGYTMRNVARCWCYETGRMLGLDLPDSLPDSALRDYDYYDDTHRLRISVSNMKNANPSEMLTKVRTDVLRHLSELEAAPGAQFQARPPQHKMAERPEEDMDVRGGGQAAADMRRTKSADYASDEEDDSGRPARNEGSYRDRDAGGAGRRGTPPPVVPAEVKRERTPPSARRTPPRSRTPTPPPVLAAPDSGVKSEAAAEPSPGPVAMEQDSGVGAGSDERYIAGQAGTCPAPVAGAVEAEAGGADIAVMPADGGSEEVGAKAVEEAPPVATDAEQTLPVDGLNAVAWAGAPEDGGEGEH